MSAVSRETLRRILRQGKVSWQTTTTWKASTDPDFIPKITGDAVDMKVIDRILTIPNADAMTWSRELAQKEGIFVGITAGGTFAGALQVAADAPKGANILCMLPDTGERYLSTPLFADIPADITAEEIEISKSTPGFQLKPAA